MGAESSQSYIVPGEGQIIIFDKILNNFLHPHHTTEGQLTGVGDSS